LGSTTDFKDKQIFKIKKDKNNLLKLFLIIKKFDLRLMNKKNIEQKIKNKKIIVRFFINSDKMR
jgi:hypothetical protein